MVAALWADLAMAIRALDRAEREHARRTELTRMRELWDQHMDRGSATW
jgi:N-acyl-D-aspartate/D-glutamate deacylase